VDIIGFGYSDRPKSRYTTDFFISFLQEFLENLHIDNKPSIIASSFSGRLATEFAIRFSNTIEKLVLAAPAGTKSLFTPAFLHYIFANTKNQSWIIKQKNRILKGSFYTDCRS
jgi:pimeloyl-ACP methyl ester carboxylesterase